MEVLDSCALIARGARAPARAPATVPSPWAAASPCASVSELEPRPCRALGSSLSLTQISTGEGRGWPAGAVEHGGARRRTRRRPPSPAAVRGRVRAHRLREGERMIRVSDPLCRFRYLTVAAMNFSRRSRSTAGSASPRTPVRMGRIGSPLVGARAIIHWASAAALLMRACAFTGGAGPLSQAGPRRRVYGPR